MVFKIAAIYRQILNSSQWPENCHSAIQIISGHLCPVHKAALIIFYGWRIPTGNFLPCRRENMVLKSLFVEKFAFFWAMSRLHLVTDMVTIKWMASIHSQKENIEALDGPPPYFSMISQSKWDLGVFGVKKDPTMWLRWLTQVFFYSALAKLLQWAALMYIFFMTERCLGSKRPQILNVRIFFWTQHEG